MQVAACFFLYEDMKVLYGFGWVDEVVAWRWRGRWIIRFFRRRVMAQLRAQRLLLMQVNKASDGDADVATCHRVDR